MEREGVSTLSIRGFPQALRYLLKVFSKIAFLCVCGFERSFLFERCKWENFCFVLKERVLKNHLPTRKRNQSMLMSFRQCYPTMNE